MTHTARREFSIFFPFTRSSQWGEEPSWKALQSWSSSQQVNLWMDNQETGGSPKTNQWTDGVCDWIFYHSNSKPDLNIPGLTKRQGGDWKLWISGYKLDPWVGRGVGEGRPVFPWIVFRCNIHIKITLYSLCLLKAIIMILEEEEEIQVQKMCFNSLNDGAWWVLVLKVPNEEAKVLKLLHTLTRKIYFCLPIYMYDLSQVNTPGLL